MPDSTTQKDKFYSAQDPGGSVSPLDLGSFETPKDTAVTPKTPISGEISNQPPDLSKSRREAELLRVPVEFESPTPAVKARRSARRLLFRNPQTAAPSLHNNQTTTTAVQQQQNGNEDSVALSSGEQNDGQHVPAGEDEMKA